MASDKHPGNEQDRSAKLPHHHLHQLNTHHEASDSAMIHSPTPTKPVESIFKKSDKTKSPMLKVIPDRNLKSCLSGPSSMVDVQEETSKTHTSFDIRPDVISPNAHGLLQLNEYGTFSSPSEQPSDYSHIGFTPLSATNATATPPPLRVFSLKPHDETPALNPQLKKTFYDTLRSNTSSIASEMSSTRDNKLHLLIGITGCISIHKNIYLIIEKLFEMYGKDKLEIQIILTKTAELFLTDKLHKFENLGVKIWFSDDSTKYYMDAKAKMKQHLSLQHASGTSTNLANQYLLAYELQKWTDVLLLAPLSANTIAKLINGLSDNLLTDVLHLWPTPPCEKLQSQPSSMPSLPNKTVLANSVQSPKPIIAAVALTSSMYSHPITKRQLAMLQETYPNISILKPVEKCVDVDGNISMGGMRSWPEVVDFVAQKLGSPEHPEDDDDDDDDLPDTTIDDTICHDEDDNDDDDNDDDDDDDDGDEEEVDKDTSAEEEEGHKVVELTPIIQDNTKAIEKIIRSRHNTLTRKDLEEHEKLAEKNAIINSAGTIKL